MERTRRGRRTVPARDPTHYGYIYYGAPSQPIAVASSYWPSLRWYRIHATRRAASVSAPASPPLAPPSPAFCGLSAVGEAGGNDALARTEGMPEGARPEGPGSDGAADGRLAASARGGEGSGGGEAEPAKAASLSTARPICDESGRPRMAATSLSTLRVHSCSKVSPGPRLG